MTSRRRLCHTTRKTTKSKIKRDEKKTKNKNTLPSSTNQRQPPPRSSKRYTHSQIICMCACACVCLCAYVYIYFTILYREKKSHGASKDGERGSFCTAVTSHYSMNDMRQAITDKTSPNTWHRFIFHSVTDFCFLFTRLVRRFSQSTCFFFFFSKQWTVPGKTSAMQWGGSCGGGGGWGGGGGESNTWKMRTGSRLVSKVTRLGPQLKTTSVTQCVLSSEGSLCFHYGRCHHQILTLVPSLGFLSFSRGRKIEQLFAVLLLPWVSALPPSSGSAGQLHCFYTGIVVEGGKYIYISKKNVHACLSDVDGRFGGGGRNRRPRPHS